MATTARLAAGLLLAAMLPLAGCSSLERWERKQLLEPLGFVTPVLLHRSVHHHHSVRAEAAARPATTATPQAVSVTVPAESGPAVTGSTTPLSQCNTALYLKAATSPEELKALEDKCRETVVKQGY